MNTSFRLPSGGRIDRGRPIQFRFDEKALCGFAGDSVASALLANGVRLVGRSFRLHRPRGVVSSGLEEPNALVHVRLGDYEEPNTRATLMPLVPGLEVFSQNRWPSLRWDLGSLNDLLPKLWTAGFYHKTFIWPSWRLYEPFIRRLAGLGRVQRPDASVGVVSQRDLQTEVIVCGGGPAGIAAASAAARCGARVTLLHAGNHLGEVRTTPETVQTQSARVFCETTAIGVFGERVILAEQHLGWGVSGPHRRMLRIRARSLIVATGSVEQPLVFDNNDRPGVMLSGAVTRFIDRYAVLPGKRVVLVTNNDEAYGALTGWRSAGIVVVAVIDSRSSFRRGDSSLLASLEIPLIVAPQRIEVVGSPAVRGLRVWENGSGRRWNLDCDLVAMAGGWMPNAHLFSQGGGVLAYEATSRAFNPAQQHNGLYAAGAAAGIRDVHEARVDADRVGGMAAAYAIHGRNSLGSSSRRAPPRSPVGPTRFSGRAHRQWIDYQHDVTVADTAAAVEQGYTQVEHFKRYTTTGMAVDQGKTSLRNALEQLAEQSQQKLESLKPPTFRAPYVPLSLALAAGPSVGQLFRPTRLLPCQIEHREHEAHFEQFGGWSRPAHYGAETAPTCIEREIRAARTSVGLFDASPLGKLEISGPDAVEFLDRLYTTDLRTLQPGRVKYALMLRDNGTVLDDGTVARTATDEFLITTTSANAGRIYMWMREWAQCEWPQLRVLITSVTSAWGTITLSGPRARQVLERAGTSVDLAPGAFPHMALRFGEIAGLFARIYRVSFTGELSYEINVRVDQTTQLWKALLAAGSEFSIRPYGLDALNIMRTEKGYLHIGVDTDSTTSPLDLGWANAIARKQRDFVGRGALTLAEYQRQDRLQFVGIAPRDTQSRLVAGAHLIRGAGARSEGFLTSAFYSATLGRTVALARLEGGSRRMGEALLAYDQGTNTAVTVVPPCSYDLDNERLKG